MRDIFHYIDCSFYIAYPYPHNLNLFHFLGASSLSIFCLTNYPLITLNALTTYETPMSHL